MDQSTLNFESFISTKYPSRASLDETSPIFKTIVGQAMTCMEHRYTCTMKAKDVQHACDVLGIEVSGFDESLVTPKLVRACKARVADILSEEFHVSLLIAHDAAKLLSFLYSTLQQPFTSTIAKAPGGRTIHFESPRGVIQANFFQMDWDLVDQFPDEDDVSFTLDTDAEHVHVGTNDESSDDDDDKDDSLCGYGDNF